MFNLSYTSPYKGEVKTLKLKSDPFMGGLGIYEDENGIRWDISMIIGGTHIGETANIEDVEVIPSSKPNLAKMKGESEFSTLQKYVFPIGKNKPVIQLPEVKIQ